VWWCCICHCWNIYQHYEIKFRSPRIASNENSRRSASGKIYFAFLKFWSLEKLSFIVIENCWEENCFRISFQSKDSVNCCCSFEGDKTHLSPFFRKKKGCDSRKTTRSIIFWWGREDDRRDFYSEQNIDKCGFLWCVLEIPRMYSQGNLLKILQ